jgi:hypothetical protein
LSASARLAAASKRSTKATPRRRMNEPAKNCSENSFLAMKAGAPGSTDAITSASM